MTYSRATRLRRKSSPTRRSSDLDGALRPGALPEPAPDRARSPGRDADARGARGDVRRRDRHAAGRGARDGDPAPTPPLAMAHAVLDPFAEPFMRRALAELLLLGVVGGLVGCWVLLYQLAYSTESLAHALFPGLVLAALLGLPLLVGGAVGVLAAAVAIAFVGRIPLLERDTGVAVVITSLFGLGVVLALSPCSPPGLESLLFGDLLGVTRGDLVISSVLVAATGAAVVTLHRPLLVAGFDRGSARAFGARPFLVDA